VTDPRDHAEYQEWDAAYVLGSLSPVERREYEAHLETCDRCRMAVAELSGLPGLLGRVAPERAFSLLDPADERDAVVIPLPAPDDRTTRAERRRPRRWVVIGGIAAAILVAGAIAVPVTIAAQPHPTVAVALAPTTTSPLTAQVQLTGVTWGTRIDMRCGYGTESTWGDPADEGDWSYSLWVIDRSGKASELSTWKATAGSQVKLTAATALSVGQIARIEVRSASTNDVLLAKRL
jgi:anti-sigma-K factor RskA